MSEPTPNPYTVSADQIREYCINNLGWGPDCTTDTYICPTRDWFIRTFGEAWSKTLDLLGIEYQEGAFDCRDFAAVCVSFIKLCHQRTPNKPDPKAAVAVGRFGYVRWNNKPHMVVIAFHLTNGKLSHSFLEPQSGKEMTLYDPEEKWSSTRIDLL